MNWPKVPWKNDAAIPGAVTSSIVRITPTTPCCIAMLFRPCSPNPANSLSATQNFAAIARVRSIAIVDITYSTARLKIVPIPYNNQR